MPDHRACHQLRTSTPRLPQADLSSDDKRDAIYLALDVLADAAIDRLWAVMQDLFEQHGERLLLVTGGAPLLFYTLG